MAWLGLAWQAPYALRAAAAARASTSSGARPPIRIGKYAAHAAAAKKCAAMGADCTLAVGSESGSCSIYTARTLRSAPSVVFCPRCSLPKSAAAVLTRVFPLPCARTGQRQAMGGSVEPILCAQYHDRQLPRATRYRPVPLSHCLADAVWSCGGAVEREAAVRATARRWAGVSALRQQSSVLRRWLCFL